MSKINKTIEISDLYRAIKIVQNEISMKEKTLKEIDELEIKCQHRDFSASTGTWSSSNNNIIPVE